MKSDQPEYFRPLWDAFDGELFQDLVCDLLRAEKYHVEPSGVGPDGGIDAFAGQDIVYGYNNPERFTWAVQCKFRSDATRALAPADVPGILESLRDERFASRGVSGYFLATNVRLSVNLMGQLRGMNGALPCFRTTFWDRARIHDILEQHYAVYRKYFLPPSDQTGSSGAPPASSPSGGPAGGLGTPTPTVIPTGAISQSLVDEFAALIESPNTREVEIQALLERHPELLGFGVSGESRVLSHPVLQPREGDPLAPDFLLRASSVAPWSIVELKRPSVEILRGGAGRQRISASIMEGIAQLYHYRSFFEAEENRRIAAEQFGVEIVQPRLVLVAGRGSGHEREIASLRQQISDVEIVTYDALLELARLRSTAE